MTSAPVRDPLADHLLTPQNAAFLFIDYQPAQLATARSIPHYPMTSGPMRYCTARTPLNAVAFTFRTEILMSEARNADVQISVQT